VLFSLSLFCVTCPNVAYVSGLPTVDRSSVFCVICKLTEEQTTQWPKEEEQTTQWPKEEEQTTQRPKEEEQTTQWPKEEEQTTQWPKEEEQTIYGF
jgi:hypothetical protein